VRAIAEELKATSTVPRVVLVIVDEDRVKSVRWILDEVVPRSRPPRR